MGGVETYLRELIRFLPASSGNDSLLVYINPEHRDTFVDSDALSVIPAAIYKCPDPRWFVRGVLRRAFGLDVSAHDLSRIKADVIHYPFTVLAPQVMDRPTVLTFWDMQHEFYPEYFQPDDLALRAKTYKASALQATRVIVSAEFTKQCLVERYSIDEKKIDVVYSGCSPDYRVIQDNGVLNRAKAKYGLDRDFMVYPAATWPHKNHSNLLDALKLLVDDRQFDGMLVLTGIAMQNHNEILRKISDLNLDNRVKILGYVPYGDLPCIYTLARLMIFPSLFEGFGLPLVEAMACGCPVLAANRTSIPEVLGGAGRLFDPTSVEDIAATIWSVWNDEKQLADLRGKGLERVHYFRWENTAAETMAVYRRAFEQA